MTLFVSRFRSAKANAETAIGAHALQMQTTPYRQLLAPESSPSPAHVGLQALLRSARD